MTRIDALASERQYAQHLAPIWAALPPDVRGEFYVHSSIAADAERAGIVVNAGPRRVLPGSGPVLVASYQDARTVRPRRVVLVQHGAGQRYVDGQGAGHPSYSGGSGRETVGLFLCPGEADAAVCRDASPQARAVAVGAPYLDRWHQKQETRNKYLDSRFSGVRGPHAAGGNGPDPTYDAVSTTGTGHREGAHTLPIVALSHHFDLRLVPETRWAYPHFAPGYPALAADRRWRLLGHGHPRAWVALEREWRRLGIPSTPSFADVLDRASLYVCDNSSTLYEFASTGRPVLCLNAPWYRRDVEQPPRFWSHVPGLQCDRPEDLADMVALAWSDPPGAQALRRAAVHAVYDGLCDGHAAQRAAAAVVAWLEEGDVGPVRTQTPGGRG